MRTLTERRWAALAGVGYVVLTVIGDLLPGAPPKLDDPARKITAFFLDHHRSVLVGAALTGIAVALFVWLVAALARELRAAGQQGFAVVALAAGVAGAALGAAADTAYGALAQIADGGDPDVVRATYLMSGFLIERAFWFGALLTLVAGLAALGGLTRWYAWTSLAATPLLALGGLSVKQSGFFGVGSDMALIAFVALLVWVLATSWLLWQLKEAPTPEAVAAPAG
jgi:hypothetical protein